MAQPRISPRRGHAGHSAWLPSAEGCRERRRMGRTGREPGSTTIGRSSNLGGSRSQSGAESGADLPEAPPAGPRRCGQWQAKRNSDGRGRPKQTSNLRSGARFAAPIVGSGVRCLGHFPKFLDFGLDEPRGGVVYCG